MNRLSPAPQQHKFLGATGWIAITCLVLLFVVLAASINTKPYMPPKVAQKYMEHWLIESARRVAGEVRLKHVRSIEPFYLRREYQPVWMDSYELTKAGQELMQVLRETAADDWRHYGYELATLERETIRLSNIPKQATAVEVLLTDAFVTYAKQALNAELLPDTGEGDHPVRKVSLSSAVPNPGAQISEDQILDLLNQAIQEDRLDQLVDQLTPSHPGYLKLRGELNRYLDIANSGRWYPLPDDLALQTNDRHRLVPHLRWMLSEYGDLSKSALSWFFKADEKRTQAPAEHDNYDLNQAEFLFDAPLAEALKKFQQRHNINASGTLDDQTRQHLNAPPYQVAQRIALNMKRWRHLPQELGQRHVMVNMADYRLRLMNGGSSELDMKVIIGNLKRRTPVMSHQISLLELAPTWSVPRRIAVTSLLPKLKRNPNYLNEKGYQVIQHVNGVDKFVDPKTINWKKLSARYFPYRLIQKAGKDNALGTIKFLFPNDQDIYLHDTSQRQLFSLDKRALSSGCVRVEKPRLLAEKLLRGQQGWHRSNIDSAIDQNRTTRIRLQDKVPVYLMYWTTWVDDDGNLQVRDDVYKRDLIAGLAPTNPAVSL